MSTFFNLRVPFKEKEISHHPWENTIKDIYSHKIKTAHNSTNNPRYPIKKEKPVDKDRVKFTVIGNRVTEEFIYCVNLVKGLYTYRKKHFECPIIRGVTSVEWPIIWNDLKLQFGGLAYCLTSQVAVLINDNILGGEKELKELIDAKYSYHLSLDYCKESTKNFANFIKGSGRPCVYMHISINNEHIGTMLFMLYADVAPFTCENFLRLCKETKGGYSGTPIHRIVKDGWIQCGGFGLKDTKFYCENFIVPPDRRGVLCMANAGRHVECSTQFFVLLQPAPWMLHKYVAFGQLIDGESTLQKIEKVETWYESPTSNILIYKCGILNLDCQDIVINRGAKEYIHGHIEDLFAIGEIFFEELMMKVFLEIQFRENARLEMEGEGAEAREETENVDTANLHATERFMRKKAGPEGQKSIDKSMTDQKSPKTKSQVDQKSAKSQIDQRQSKADTRSSKVDTKLSADKRSGLQATSAASKSEHENNDFDVSVYEYEPEEYSYQHVSPDAGSIEVKPEKPYYIPLTDVPYPGETDSQFDLKRFLKGDYCLESDLKVKTPAKFKACVHEVVFYPSEHLRVSFDSPPSSDSSLDSDEETEIKRYLTLNTDNVSFAGSIIRSIARGFGKHDLQAGYKRSELLTDEELRKIRVASQDLRRRESHSKKVSLSVPEANTEPREIKRRQTGFVRQVDLEKVHLIHKTDSATVTEDDSSMTCQRKVRVIPAQPVGSTPRLSRRTTALKSDIELGRQSVLTRLYDDYQYDGDLPTLKDYKHPTESTNRNLMLTKSTNLMSSEDKMDHYRRGFMNTDESLETIHHQKKLAPKVSSPEHRRLHSEISIRNFEHAKRRPSMSVGEYQAKNQKYQETKKAPNKVDSSVVLVSGLRLPGDSPLYPSSDEIETN